MIFHGYYRDNGSIGVRNHVLIIPTVICASSTAKLIAERVYGVKYLNNPYGCGQVGEDLKQTVNTLIGLGVNPNVAAVLVVSLGCEGVDAKVVTEEIAKSGKPVELLVIQEVGGTLKTVEKGVRIVREMVQEALKLKREEASVSKLIVALECGGSDTTSGIASNPAVGVASDMIIDMGGTVIISEVPEFIGAEHIFAERAVNEDVKMEIIKTVIEYEKYLKSYGVDFRGAQPSPGNIAGGLTTIEEKSLGAIHKAGRSIVKGVLKYAEKPSGNGLYLMNTPGFDVSSIVGMVAGGAQIILFTTGRGTPVGNPIAPVIKITGNPETAEKMRDDLDVDVSGIILGTESIEEAGRKI
ncbi:MAG: UxaA family hydrolase, partial [Candidatus Methanomethylicia archaeon]